MNDKRRIVMELVTSSWFTHISDKKTLVSHASHLADMIIEATPDEEEHSDFGKKLIEWLEDIKTQLMERPIG